MAPTRLTVPMILLLSACFPQVDLTEGNLGLLGDTGGGGSGEEGGEEGGGDEGGDDGGETVVGQLVVSVGQIDEGLVFLGHKSTRDITVTNVGPGSATAQLVIGGTSAESWSIAGKQGDLEAGAATTLVLTFEPAEWGLLAAELVVTDLVSTDSSSISMVAEVQVDDDGDGVGSLESGGSDCDDADAYVYPGAEETWYDGIDSDCAGDNDYDQDGDGVESDVYGGTDCDDTDATVLPGAEDTWYDGVDSDCGGEDDYDRDGDGHQSHAWGGDDCDDGDATINPSATESWYDGVDADCDGWSDYDADYDGHDAEGYGGDDCDDAEATTYTGATETWYDGVDSDCDGASDFDQDGDGEDSEDWGGGDCDDTDGAVNTSATETWYDGVDSDCDGWSDYDQDLDGEDSDSWGGDDCDDSDAAVNTSATETWYDGTDSDCDGLSDYDRDKDGYDHSSYGGSDCNDNNKNINPGATETWYDGTDSDCDGWSDYDQDLDGYDSDDHGGTDCDDTDASIGEATDETLNGVDDDCNGQVDDLYVSDAATGVVYGYDSNMAVGNVGTFMVAPDLTNDGDVEVVVLTDEIDYGYIWVVEGADLDGASDDLDAVDTAYGEGYYYGYFPRHAASVLGDVTGDGVTDLLFGTEGTPYYSTGDYGFVYAYTGGSGISGTLDLEDPDGGYWGDSASDGGKQSSVLDVNGDGVGDVVMGAPYDSKGDKGKVAIFTGGSSFSGYLDFGDADDAIAGKSDGDEFGTSITGADLDGDGYDDFVAGAPGDDDDATDAGAVYIFMGNGTVSYGNDADTANTVKITGGSSSVDLGEDPLPQPGDVDGDGNADLLIPDEDGGDAWLFLGAGSMSDTGVSGADHTFSGTAGDFASAAVINTDLDSDGADEVILGADSADVTSTDSGAVYIYMYSSSWGSSLSASDADAVIWGDDTGDYLGTGLAGGYDVDGDGLEDLLIGAVGVDDGASYGGAIYLIPGW